MPQVRGLDGCVTGRVSPEKVNLVLTTAPASEQVERVSALFKLLGDATRARLLYALLAAGELCVCDLAAATGTTESTASQALRLLRTAGVVTGRRDHRNVFYRLSDDHVQLLLEVSRAHTDHTTPAGRPRSTGPR